MPDMDGLQLLQYVHDYKLPMQVVVISGYEEFTYAHKALTYKAKGYVLKPIDTGELVAIVDDIIANLSPATDTPKREPERDAEQPTYHEAIVRLAISYAENNLDQPLTLTEAADKVNLSPHYFGQVFKAVTGQTFIAYLTRIRMEKACELLMNPLLKHNEISKRIGFADPQYFSKVFQKTYGMTLRDYRQQYQKQK